MELKYKNDIESVLSPYIVLKRRGSNLVGLCPFHNEKTPSFTVYPENGSYYCFGCGQGGDVITFMMRIENLDYIDAVKRLADRAGLRLPETGSEEDKKQKLRSDIYNANREAAKFFHSCLMSELGKPALEYLTGRGLTINTIRHFGLGYAPDDWHALENHLKSKGISESVMKAADLVSKSQKTDKNGNNYTFDRFRNRVMFPIINVHGKVIAFGGRAMPGREKADVKYINTSDTEVYKKSHNLYALNFAKNTCAERVILVEGNVDVITLHQAGFSNTVGALGTSFTEEQAKLLSRYTKEILVTLDSDAAGEKGTARTIKILRSVGLKVKIVRVPDGKDPDDFVRKNGAARFEALIDSSYSDIEYKLITAARGIDLDAPDGMVEYLGKACEVLAESDDAIAVELYAGKLSAKYGVSRDKLETRIKDIAEKRRKSENRKLLENIVIPKANDSINPQKKQYARAAAAEEAMITVLIKHPDMLEYAAEKVDSSDFLTDFNRRLFIRVSEILSTGHEFDLVLLGGDFTPDEIGYVTKMLTLGAGNANAQKELDDSMTVILEEKAKAASEDITLLTDDEWANAMKKLSEKRKL